MKTTVGLWGSGWRAEYFLRVAKYLPDSFEISGLITRSDEKAARFTQEFGVKCYKTLDDFLLNEKAPAFMVVSVTASKNVEFSLDLLNRGIPVLLETPPATNLADLDHFQGKLPADAKIQIAEQYPFHPMHLAQHEFIKSGKLGEIQFAQVSFSHAYHGVGLIRRFLGVGIEDAQITATQFPINVMGGTTRGGEPTKEEIVQKTQTIAVLKFPNNKTGLLNFELDQHRSWVRSSIIQIKGTHGEIFNSKIKYLHDYKTPIETDLVRKHLGIEDNFEGVDLKGILADGKWLYKNPYVGSRLVDDEIAVATCMSGMAEYVKGVAPFYSLQDASHDTKLGILIEQAIADSN